MDYKDLTISEFISHLSSSEPVPGGGVASSLAAALGLALGNMVGNLTLGKKKYANVQEDIIRLNNISQKLQESFLLLIDKDAEAFKPLSKAYGLPKDTCELLEKREKIFEEALVNASAAPIEIMKSCCEALDILDDYCHQRCRRRRGVFKKRAPWRISECVHKHRAYEEPCGCGKIQRRS